jgi:hypothetical protein
MSAEHLPDGRHILSIISIPRAPEALEASDSL